MRGGLNKRKEWNICCNLLPCKKGQSPVFLENPKSFIPIHLSKKDRDTLTAIGHHVNEFLHFMKIVHSNNAVAAL